VDETDFPTRRKGMHQSTYERLLDELAEVDLDVQEWLETPGDVIDAGDGSAEGDDGGYWYPAFKRSRGAASVDAIHDRRGVSTTSVPRLEVPRIQATIKEPGDYSESLNLLRRILEEMNDESGT
jgi:hypothetical protein